jgi:hypothetical protein
MPLRETGAEFGDAAAGSSTVEARATPLATPADGSTTRALDEVSHVSCVRESNCGEHSTGANPSKMFAIVNTPCQVTGAESAQP